MMATGDPFQVDAGAVPAGAVPAGAVHHVFPYDPQHLGVSLDQWWRGQLLRWPLAAVARSARAADTVVHVIAGPHDPLPAGVDAGLDAGLRLSVHRTAYSNARRHAWGDDWSMSLGRALGRLGHDDVVVLHLEGYPAARLSMRFAHRARCVLVLHGRGTGSAQDHDATDVTVVLHDESRDVLIDRGVAADRLIPMVPSIDRELFVPHGMPRPAPRPVLGYVGRMERSKGAFELPGVLRSLSDLNVRLECIGSMAGSDEETAAAFADLPVEFFGERAPAFVAERMREWSALVLPSYSEGLPLVALEALSSGVPVVAVEGVLPRTLADRHGVLVGPRESLAERVRAAVGASQDTDSAWIPGHDEGGAAWDAVYRMLPTWRPRFRPSARLLLGHAKRAMLGR